MEILCFKDIKMYIVWRCIQDCKHEVTQVIMITWGLIFYSFVFAVDAMIHLSNDFIKSRNSI